MRIGICQNDPYGPVINHQFFLTRNGKAAQAGFENLNMQAHDQDLWIDFAGRGILLSGLDPSEFNEVHVVFDSFGVWLSQRLGALAAWGSRVQDWKKMQLQPRWL